MTLDRMADWFAFGTTAATPSAMFISFLVHPPSPRWASLDGFGVVLSLIVLLPCTLLAAASFSKSLLLARRWHLDCHFFTPLMLGLLHPVLFEASIRLVGRVVPLSVAEFGMVVAWLSRPLLLSQVVVRMH